MSKLDTIYPSLPCLFEFRSLGYFSCHLGGYFEFSSWATHTSGQKHSFRVGFTSFHPRAFPRLCFTTQPTILSPETKGQALPFCGCQCHYDPRNTLRIIANVNLGGLMWSMYGLNVLELFSKKTNPFSLTRPSGPGQSSSHDVHVCKYEYKNVTDLPPNK